jgi:hypothetical protein
MVLPGQYIVHHNRKGTEGTEFTRILLAEELAEAFSADSTF